MKTVRIARCLYMKHCIHRLNCVSSRQTWRRAIVAAKALREAIAKIDFHLSVAIIISLRRRYEAKERINDGSITESHGRKRVVSQRHRRENWRTAHEHRSVSVR